VREKLQSLQVLRALAAMLVVFDHVPCISRGSFGVDIFFVISGFVIALVAETDSDRFFFKRIFRIVPLYWLATICVFLVALVAPHALRSGVADPVLLVKSLGFIPFLKSGGGIHPLLPQGWTLNYEMMFYLLFALCLAVARRYAVISAAALICLIVLLGRIWHPTSIPLLFWTDPIILEFVFGLFLFTIWRKSRLSGPWWLVYSLVAVLLTALAWLQPRYPIHRIAALPAAVIVGAVLLTERSVRYPKWLIMTGDASYSLYLLHLFIVIPSYALMAHVGMPLWGRMAMTPAILGVTILVAMMTFRTIERPSNSWLRAWLHGWGHSGAPKQSRASPTPNP
jgi:peptidoglycan/LPS O-acetylase OafA/YrhL